MPHILFINQHIYTHTSHITHWKHCVYIYKSMNYGPIMSHIDSTLTSQDGQLQEMTTQNDDLLWQGLIQQKGQWDPMPLQWDYLLGSDAIVCSSLLLWLDLVMDPLCWAIKSHRQCTLLPFWRSVSAIQMTTTAIYLVYDYYNTWRQMAVVSGPCACKVFPAGQSL